MMLDYGNYGILLIIGNAGFISSTVLPFFSIRQRGLGIRTDRMKVEVECSGLRAWGRFGAPARSAWGFSWFETSGFGV